MKPSLNRHALAGLLVGIVALQAAWAGSAKKPVTPRSPIQHLIVVTGENRGFDHFFATYTPKSGQTIWNLLSRGIVKPDGNPGDQFTLAEQQQTLNTIRYEISPSKVGPFSVLPQPNTTLDALPLSPCDLGFLEGGGEIFCTDSGIGESAQYLLSDNKLATLQFGVYTPPKYYPKPDCRYSKTIPNGPYWIVGEGSDPQCPIEVPDNPVQPVQYSSYAGDPVHRFYQMWQQSDCSILYASADNPSGCLGDLHTWVATSVGWDITPPPSTPQDTYQGGVAMGYYNMAQGDLPYFKSLADDYAFSDNYHQPVMGGTGPNSQFMFTGDVYYYTNAKGRPAKPNEKLIENPDPSPGTNNYYINDAFGSVDGGSTGVGFTKCSDVNQPGVRSIMNYLRSLPYKPFRKGNCDGNRWYQVNNNYPYYNTDGSIISYADVNAFPAGPGYSIGPQTIPTIGDAMARRSVSWKYYGQGMKVVNNGNLQNTIYCEICNGFQYAKSIMTTKLKNNLVDLEDFYADLDKNYLPAVSFVKPGILNDGHPGTSTPKLFEEFVRKLVESVKQHDALWQTTAILITFDEDGGYYDSGYIQPIDFFGDGPRTVMIVVSPHARKGGYVDHTYSDHASILKFIEWNWRLKPLSNRSRDNLPNPIVGSNPYLPVNSPAIGDLRTLFNFQ